MCSVTTLLFLLEHRLSARCVRTQTLFMLLGFKLSVCPARTLNECLFCRREPEFMVCEIIE